MSPLTSWALAFHLTFERRLHLIVERRLTNEDRSYFLPDFNSVTDVGFPFTHGSGERRFDRIDRLIRLNFAKRIVQFDAVAGIFQQRHDLRRANPFAHDWHSDALRAPFRCFRFGRDFAGRVLVLARNFGSFAAGDVLAATDDATLFFGVPTMYARLAEAPGIERLGRLRLCVAGSAPLAADLHVHAFASDDSKMPNQQRVIAQTSMGIAVIGLSDHNHAGDLNAET